MLTGRALVTAGAINLDGNVISVVLPGRFPLYMVSTLAGNGIYGEVDGAGTDASFAYPRTLTLDAANNVYVTCDGGQNRNVRKVSPLGLVSTLIANNSVTTYNYNLSVAVDHAGNVYTVNNHYDYNYDNYDYSIQKMTPTGDVTKIAIGTTSNNNNISALALDGSDNLYIFENGLGTIRKIATDGTVTTIGDLSGTNTNNYSNHYANSLAIDASGNVYVADVNQNKIFKVTAMGTVSVFAGSGHYGSVDGVGEAASFYYPYGIALDASENIIVADLVGNKIRMITPAGVVTTIAGIGNYGSVDGAAMDASFSYPVSVAIDAAGSIYVADYLNNKIRKMTIVGYTDVAPTTTVAPVAAGQSNYSTDQSALSAAAAMSFLAPAPFSVIQNPVVNNQLRINMPKDATISIYNNLGQVLLVKALAAGKQTIALPTLTKGMYNVKCGAEVKKFVVQ